MALIDNLQIIMDRLEMFEEHDQRTPELWAQLSRLMKELDGQSIEDLVKDRRVLWSNLFYQKHSFVNQDRLNVGLSMFKDKKMLKHINSLYK